ncbi:MAG: hypothetical protein WEB57_12155 [Pseudohongiellaceae bacterium]
MNRFLKVLLTLFVVLALAALYVLNPRLPTPDGEQSASLYQPGTLRITREPVALTDTSRATPPNGDFRGSAERNLDGFIWYPEAREAGPFPLIVYSHGFMSSVAEAEYVVDFLVPKGYAVVAVDYPLSHGGAPGGPTVTDVLNQAGDVSFVIDSMLARNADAQDSLHGLLDPSRIAAVGLSLGGMTTQLAAYHRDERDRRLAAAVSIAGPSEALERAFFQTTDIPFLMIAGSSDAIVPYEANAAPIPDKVDNSLLVTLDDASHTGFASVASTFMRWFNHPDALVCPMLLDGLEGESGDRDKPMLEPDPSVNIVASNTAPCTMDSFDRSMRPGKQQMLTRLALYAFLEMSFSSDADRRTVMNQYLTVQFARENPSASVEGEWGTQVRSSLAP